ncbi:MAG TPA: transketolase [Lachnospiraceae bacterium]|nr:transketolase [Lachnospiraceae bacterium]
MDYVKNNRMLALLGQRGTFGTVLCGLAGSNEKIVALSADLARVSGLDKFIKKYPDRYLNVGIAEENAVGMAAGIADSGKIPFLTTFSNFAVMRANEFVRHFMSYMNCNVKLVGLGSGFAMELFGTTHYGLEDIAVIRSLPNITILSPSDCMEAAKCVEASMDIEGPVYLRLSGKMNNPIIHRQDYDFVVGRAIEEHKGSACVVFATGSMVSTAVKAAEELDKEGIGVKVVNMHTIKPFDRNVVISNRDKKVMISIEEHSKIGGLGTAVSEVLTDEGYDGRLIRMGTDDVYKKAGTYEYMLGQHGLTVSNLVKTVKDNMD